MRAPKPPASTLILLAMATSIVLLTGACTPPVSTPTKPRGEATGLRVGDDPTVTFMVWFKTGSQNDPPGKEGLAALTGALISGGATKNHTYEEILKELYPLAASYRVEVDKEMTTLSGRTHVDNIDAFFALFADAYVRPALNEDDFERLRSNALNTVEKTLRYSSDEELGKAALAGFVFQGTPYSHPVVGTVEGLRSMTLADVRKFYRAWYTEGNATVALAGNYSDELLDRFQKTLGELPPGEAAAPPVLEPLPIRGRHALLVSKEGADASISLGFPISVRRGDRDYYALWVANSWLGEHRSSVGQLYKVIRDARGMNYGNYSYIEAFPRGEQILRPPTNVARRHQLFEIWIRTLPNEQAVFALRAALRELSDLVMNGMTEEEFELSRSFMSKYHLLFAQTTRERLGYAVDDAFYGIRGEGNLERFGRIMGELTLEEVNTALKKHLDPENLKIAMVTGATEELAETLRNDTPTPMSYEIAKPEEILEEDKEIERFPLGIDSVTTVPIDEIFEK